MKPSTILMTLVCVGLVGCATTSTHQIDAYAGANLNSAVSEPNSLILGSEIEREARIDEFVGKYPHWTELDKINYLLNAINSSGMKFFRNGETYTSNQAMKWLRWKMYHKQFKNKPISTARDFIARVATRSNNSGLDYQLVLSSGKYIRNADALTLDLDVLEAHLEKKLMERVVREAEISVNEVVSEQMLDSALSSSASPAPTSAH